jgi:hypothetical protein
MSFASVTDWWGLSDSNCVLQSSDKVGDVAGNASVADSVGDVQCETVYGDQYTYETVYKLINGDTEDFASAKLGQNFSETGSVDVRAINSIAVNTSNTDFPEITISGRTIVGSSDGEWTPGISVVGKKAAQKFGFTAAASTFLQSSSATASLQTEAVVLGDSGDLAAVEFAGARLEASGELSACSVAPSATADSGYTLAKPIGVNSENVNYQTASIEVFKNIVRDA